MFDHQRREVEKRISDTVKSWRNGGFPRDVVINVKAHDGSGMPRPNAVQLGIWEAAIEYVAAEYEIRLLEDIAGNFTPVCIGPKR